MTGTNPYNRCFAGTAVLALLAAMMPPQVAADDLILEGKEQLSGKVLAIDLDGTVLLDTALAPEPVALNGESVSKVLFSASEVKVPPAGCQVALLNGDVLPAEIEAIDDRHLTLRSSVAGPLVIPRAMVSSLSFGASLPEVIFAGPDGLGGWTQDPPAAEAWAFDKGALRAGASGTISRQLELPQNFIVRFKLAWDAPPNFKFHFASPAKAGEGAVDQYFLQFNSAGFEIKRESSTGRHFPEMNARSSRLPSQFPGKRLEVEIRVDRAGGKVHLLLNDKLEGIYKEPLAKPPTGGRIAFENTTDEEGNSLSVSEIEVLEWDLKDVPQPAKERGDKTKDVLKTVSKESYSGTLTGIKRDPEGLLYVFKGAFQEAPIEVPEAEIASLLLATPAGESPPAMPCPISLRLLGGGSLRVSACKFTEERVEATHPLLGPVKLQRERITALERVKSQPKVEKKSL